jgi:hypothetical protein
MMTSTLQQLLFSEKEFEVSFAVLRPCALINGVYFYLLNFQ